MDTPSCSVPLEAQPLDCCVSSRSGLLAAGLVSGQLQLVTFSCPVPTSVSAGGAAGTQLCYQLGHTIRPPGPSSAAAPKGPPSGKNKAAARSGPTGDEAPSCRAVTFTPEGEALLAGYSDHAVRLYDVTTGKLVREFSGEHDQQLSRVFGVAPGVFASGDEEGLVVLWDSRSGCSTYRYTQHTDYITDFALHAREQALVATSGDATLSVHDLRKRKAIARSEDDNDDELLSCAVVKGGKKVVAGTQSGVLHLYSWGYFNDCSDRFPGHPESVQALVAFDEDTLLTGSSDGGVRVVGVLPNRLLGILGQHHEDFPVERLALSHDRRVLASTSHDSAVKLWDLSVLHDDDGDGEDAEEGGEAGEEGAEPGAEVHKATMEGADGGPMKDGEGAEAGTESGSGDGEGSDGDSSEWDEDEDEDEDEELSGDEGGGSEDGEDDEKEEGGRSGGEECKSGGGDEGADAGESGKRMRDGARGKGRRGARAASGGAAGTSGTGAPDTGKASVPGRLAAAATAANATAPAAGAGAKKGDGGGGEDSDEGSGGSGDDSDSDGDGGGQKRKRSKRERTKWTKGAEQRKRPAANFFADLL